MGKKKKSFLLVFLVLIAFLGVIGYWQRNNLAALKLAFQHSGDDLTAQMEDTRKQLSDSAKEKADITIRDLSEEEKQSLKDNTVSRDELIDKLISTPQPEAPGTPEAPAPAAKPEPVPEQKPAEDPNREKLSRLIAELYVMQEEYNTWLADSNQAAIDEFNALPAEKQTSSNKYKIGLRYLDLAKEKEKECDARMAEMEASIKDLLIKLGEDTGLVNDIHKTYVDEKALKKAYYLGLH